MSKKTKNAEFAKEWCNLVESSEKWMDYINKSINNTIVRKGTLVKEEERAYALCKSGSANTELKVTKDKTYNTLLDLSFEEGAHTICVLNFGAYYKPGGGFVKGSFAQEESLCSISGLYQILKSLPVYEQRVKSKDISSCYNDEIIYNANVPYTLDIGETKYHRTFDTITCSAPNCNRVTIADQKEYEVCIAKRAEAIYLLPYLQRIDTLILGSWGCGAFKNNPRVIAKAFMDVINKYPNIYNKIIFACGSEVNQWEFIDVLSSYSE